MMQYLQYPLFTILSDDESGMVAEMNYFHNLNHNEAVLGQKSRQNLIIFLSVTNVTCFGKSTDGYKAQ